MAGYSSLLGMSMQTLKYKNEYPSTYNGDNFNQNPMMIKGNKYKVTL